MFIFIYWITYLMLKRLSCQNQSISDKTGNIIDGQLTKYNNWPVNLKSLAFSHRNTFVNLLYIVTVLISSICTDHISSIEDCSNNRFCDWWSFSMITFYILDYISNILVTKYCVLLCVSKMNESIYTILSLDLA